MKCHRGCAGSPGERRAPSPGEQRRDRNHGCRGGLEPHREAGLVALLPCRVRVGSRRRMSPAARDATAEGMGPGRPPGNGGRSSEGGVGSWPPGTGHWPPGPPVVALARKGYHRDDGSRACWGGGVPPANRGGSGRSTGLVRVGPSRSARPGSPVGGVPVGRGPRSGASRATAGPVVPWEDDPGGLAGPCPGSPRCSVRSCRPVRRASGATRLACRCPRPTRVGMASGGARLSGGRGGRSRTPPRRRG